MKKTVAALALLVAVGCASTPMTSSTTSAGSTTGVTVSRPNEYILLSSPTQIREIDYSTQIYGLHLKGTLTSAGFQAAGAVQGKGALCADGKDWLSLSELKVYKSGEKSPTAPYLLGCASAKGFQPASRDVVLQ